MWLGAVGSKRPQFIDFPCFAMYDCTLLYICYSIQIPNSPPHPEVFVYKASGFFDASGKTTVLSGKKANREIRF